MDITVLQVTSVYPISVVRSSLSASSAVYKVSLLPGYHPSPDQEQPVVIEVSFSSPLAQQEELVTVHLLDSDQACNLTPQSSEELPVKEAPAVSRRPPSFLADRIPWIVFVVVLFALLLLMVVCVALQKTSSGGSGSGFKQPLHTSNVSTIGSQPFSHQSPGAASQYSPGISPATSQYTFKSPPPTSSGAASTRGMVDGGSGKGMPFTPSASYLSTGAGVSTPQQTFNSMSHPRRRMQSSASPKQPGLFS